MSFDEDMLTPRGLLVNSNFALQGTSFINFIVAINKMMSVPLTKQQIVDIFRFSEDLANMLIDILNDIIYLMAKGAYHVVGTLCDRISALAAAAPEDYDEIFDGLARLYKDEACNVELRNAIKARIDARLGVIRAASSLATASRKFLADSTDAIDLAQRQLQPLSQQLNGKELCDRIFQAFAPNYFKIAANLLAVKLLRLWTSQPEFTTGMTSALEELQKAVGGIAEIDMDLISLRKYIEVNTEPGPNPISNLRKGNILEMWEELDREAKKFKSNIIDTA